jgi:heavy metal translocating P-type ATPase
MNHVTNQETTTIETPSSAGDHDHRIDPADVARVALIAVAATLVGLRITDAAPIIGWTSLIVGGWPVWREAFENILERRMTMELSMSIAIVAAAAIGELFTALIIVGFVIIAEALEHMTVDRGRRAIAELLDTLPREVTVRRGGELLTVPVESVSPGEVVIVEPGARIPVDGTVTGGASFADQASVTGESMPVEKVEGDTVFAGTVNLAGSLQVSVESVGSDTTYGRIIQAVADAQEAGAPVQRLADRLAGYLVYFALGAAAITYLVTRDITSTISVVIVAGACGIAAGTPLALLGGIGRAARQGVIFKGSVHLETFGKLDTVVVDKTGTLTFGTPRVTGFVASPGVEIEDLLGAAATVEIRSEHPVGKAIVDHARSVGVSAVEPQEFHYTPGQGVAARSEGRLLLAGNRLLMEHHGVTIPDEVAGWVPDSATHAFIARGGSLLGAIAVDDEVRAEAVEAIAALQSRGLSVILLTGDNESAAHAVAEELGIDDVAAGLLPSDKLEWVQRLVAEGRTVAMVGDGINDAPALAAASVGVAMGSGTVVAHETADVILIGSNLMRIVDAYDLARRTRRTIGQNFGGTIGVDLAGMALAAFGLLTPVLAAFVHVASELAFILNSARLLPPRRRDRSAQLEPAEAPIAS